MVTREPIRQRYLKDEWHVRNQVMDACLEILSDGQPHTARQILEQLEKRKYTVPKSLVNSILFSEARRYVTYDHRTFTYTLRELDTDDSTSAIPAALPRCEAKLPQIKARFIRRNDEYVFTTSEMTSPAFFEVTSRGSRVEVKINQRHPFSPRLLELFDTPSGENSPDASKRQVQYRNVVELLLAAWSKYELEQPHGPRRFRVEEARLEWGRNATSLVFDELDETDEGS